ncbi:MAG: PP2C family protein-serine/threonine phosphatase, partial [Acidobacteriota bacterium]
GDVTGKGLKAGMLVALLVGVIQNASETVTEPLEILSALNRALLGRGDAQATCLALRIANDGSVTLANAGQLPPYLNAELLPMEGALPLGMIEAPDFSQINFRLAEGDHLILLSDGIVEATDAKGNLFGFERVEELLGRATSASQLATAAQNFGQEDDVTVLSLVWVGVKE